MKKTTKGEKMTYAVAVNSSGQATIPKAIREHLNLVPGENRLTFNVIDGKVIIDREDSPREQLLASLAKIQASNEKEKRRNPAFREASEKYKGMTYSEFVEAYEDTEEDEKRLEEKYGIKL